MKKILVILISVCLVFGLTGCGNGGIGGLGGGSDNTLSGSFSPKNDSIWYLVSSEDEVGKDTKIGKVFVFKDGEFTSYASGEGVTLGYVSQTSEEEVIDKLEGFKKDHREKMTAFFDKAKVGCDFLLASGVFDGVQKHDGLLYDFSQDKAAFEKISKSLSSYEVPVAGQEIRYGVYTDASGNAVESEIIAFRDIQGYVSLDLYRKLVDIGDKKPDLNELLFLMKQLVSVYSMGGQVNYSEGLNTNLLVGGRDDVENLMSLVCPEYTMKLKITNALDPTRGGIVVYDKVYTGFSLKGGLLLTDSDANNFVMDSLDTEGVIVDPKDDDLFKE